MSGIPAEHRSCDHTSKDQQVDVIVENNPAELQGACREVLQALTLRAALVSSIDPNQCVEAPQSYSLLTQAPYNFTFRTGNNYLLDACRIWVFKSMMGQTDADTGDIDIKDLLLYPRQERKTCVLSTGATCVVTISVTAPRNSASMTRVPPRVENAVPWGLRSAAETLDTLVQENADPYPTPLEGKPPVISHQVAPMPHHTGVGIYLQAGGRGHTRSLSPVPRTLWPSATSRLVAPPVTSLPTPMAATRSSTLTYQASPVSRRSPLAPEHPRVATYSSSGLTYSVVDSAAAPAIRVTPINPPVDVMSVNPQVNVASTTPVSVTMPAGARHMKLSVSSTGSQGSPAAVETTSAPVRDTTMSAVSASVEVSVTETKENKNPQVTVTSPPKPVTMAEGSTEVLSPGEMNENASRSTSNEVVDLEQGSAGRREKSEAQKPYIVKKVETTFEHSKPERLVVSSPKDKTEMYQLRPVVVEIETTTASTEQQLSRGDSTTNEDESEESLKRTDSKGDTARGGALVSQASESIEEDKVTDSMSLEGKENYMSELHRDIKEAIENEDPSVEASDDQDTTGTADEARDGDVSSESRTKSYEINEFWSQESSTTTSQLESATLIADPTIAIVRKDTKVIRTKYKSVSLSFLEVSVKETVVEPYCWHIQHRGSADAIIPGIIKAPWDVCINLLPSSVVRICIDMGEKGVYASGIIDIPKMIIIGASALCGSLELHRPDGSKCSDFILTMQLKLSLDAVTASPVVNLGRSLASPKYNTCVLNCLGIEDNACTNAVNTYKIGVGINNNINTYMLVDNTDISNRSNTGICLNLEDSDEKVVTIEVHKLQASRGRHQERIFLGSAKFDLNDLIRERLTKFNGALEIYDGNVKLHGTTLKVEIALEDEVEEEETETLTDVYVKSTIMKSMTLTSQRTSPQLDQTYNKLRSVIEEIPAAKAKKKMIDVLKEVPVARHKKIMTKVVKEVPIAQTKKRMAPVLEDIAKHPYRKCMSSVVEELHHHRLKKAMQPVIEEVPLMPIKKTFRKLCSEIPAAVEQRQQLKKSRSIEDSSATTGPQARATKESIVEITEEPCVFSVTSVTQSIENSVPLSHRTTDSGGITPGRQETVRQKKSSKSTAVSGTKSNTTATSTANDIASKITKAITEDPACASLDPAVVIKLLEIFRKTMVPSSSPVQSPPPSSRSTVATSKESNTRARVAGSKAALRSSSVRTKSQAK